MFPRLINSARYLTFESRRCIRVLGIETSCDDTAVGIVEDFKVLGSKRYTNREEQVAAGGISPSTVAKQHRQHLPEVIAECCEMADCSLPEVDAIAVTTRPGLVIALKEGIRKAIELARQYQKPLIPVHHMRAHALSGFLLSKELKFPFLTMLISGGHAIIAIAHSVDNFEILGQSISGSPGECLDKIARELAISNIREFANIHPGAAMEIMAQRAADDGYIRYDIPGVSANGADMNFSQLKSSLLGQYVKYSNADTFDRADFAAFAQFQVAYHLVSRFNAALDCMKSNGSYNIAHVVVSGGVASNTYIMNAINKLCLHYKIEVVKIPPSLCTDNGEMIALTAAMMILNNSAELIPASSLPEMLYAHARFPIGADCRWKVPRRAQNKLSATSIHGDAPIKLFNKEQFRAQASTSGSSSSLTDCS